MTRRMATVRNSALGEDKVQGFRVFGLGFRARGLGSRLIMRITGDKIWLLRFLNIVPSPS